MSVSPKDLLSISLDSKLSAEWRVPRSGCASSCSILSMSAGSVLLGTGADPGLLGTAFGSGLLGAAPD